MIIVESREPSVFWPNRQTNMYQLCLLLGNMESIIFGPGPLRPSNQFVWLYLWNGIPSFDILCFDIRRYHDMMLWKQHTTHIFVPKIPSNQFWHRPSFQLLMINLDKSPINWLITLWVTICYKRFFFTDFNRRFGILLVIANPKSPWFASSILGDKEPPQNLALESGDRPKVKYKERWFSFKRAF